MNEGERIVLIRRIMEYYANEKKESEDFLLKEFDRLYDTDDNYLIFIDKFISNKKNEKEKI